ncbi:MAG: pilin [Patescibacteria group bacterium]|jgi:hypothetical protein
MLKNPLKIFIISNFLLFIFCFFFFPLIAKADVYYCCCPGSNSYVGYSDSNGFCGASDSNCDGSAVRCGLVSQNPQTPQNPSQPSGPVNFTPQIGIPGSQFQPGASIAVSNNTATIAEYVKAIYKYLIGIVGITAAIMLMVGGIVWLTAGGSPERVKQAQDYIVGSLTGLALALGSFLILGMINPALVNFRISGIGTVTSPPPNGNSQYNGDECSLKGGTCFPNSCTDNNMDSVSGYCPSSGNCCKPKTDQPPVEDCLPPNSCTVICMPANRIPGKKCSGGPTLICCKD